jgi:hypothetical protein
MNVNGTSGTTLISAEIRQMHEISHRTERQRTVDSACAGAALPLAR